MFTWSCSQYPKIFTKQYELSHEHGGSTLLELVNMLKTIEVTLKTVKGAKGSKWLFNKKTHIKKQCKL